MDDYLSIFIRDEYLSWLSMAGRGNQNDQPMRDTINMNVDSILKRVQVLSCKIDKEKVK